LERVISAACARWGASGLGPDATSARPTSK
jgi:hypothetical protein